MFTELLRVSLSAGVMILVLLLFFAGLGKRYSAGLKYWVWLLLALRLLVPVTVTLPEIVSQTIPAAKVVAETQAEVRRELTERVAYEMPEHVSSDGVAATAPETDASETVQVTEGEQPRAAAPEQEAPSVDALTVAKWVWLSGTLLFLGYHLLSNCAFHRYVRRWGRATKDWELKAMVTRAKKNAGVKGPLRLLILKEVGSPLVMGIWKPTLILPQEDWDTTELYYVLRHEMIHLKRKDAIYKALLLLCNAVHWFNPLVWIMRVRAYQDLEISCDMAVVSGATQDVKISYCETIMATAQRSAMGRFSVANTFGSTKKSIMERFQEIFSVAKRKKGTALLVFVLVVAILAGCTVSLASTAGARAGNQELVMSEQAENDSEAGAKASVEETVPAEEPAAEATEGDSITLDHVNTYWEIEIPSYAKDWLYVDDGDRWLYCVKDGEEMFSILFQTSDELWSEYGWLAGLEGASWATEALYGWDYMLGRHIVVDSNYYVLRLTGKSDFPECQQLIQDILDLNIDIVPNPCLIAEPYYRAEGAEEAIELYKKMEDSDAVYEEILTKIQSGTNSAGASQQIMGEFAEFLSERWNEYLEISGAEYVWSLEYNEDGVIMLKVMRDPPVEKETYYNTYLYLNDQVVYGTTMGYKAPYEPPAEEEAAEARNVTKAKLEAANVDGISQQVIDEMAQWIQDSITFMDHYGDWEWVLAEEEAGIILSCTSEVSDKGVRSFCQLTYKDGEITSSSGAFADAPAAEAGLGRCIRSVMQTEEPQDLPDYVVLEQDLLVDDLGVSYFMNDIDVLAMLGDPVQWYPDDGSGYETARYEGTCYNFALCGQCQSYHLDGSFVEEDIGVSLPLGLEMGMSVEEVLAALGAEEGLTPSYFNFYDYDDRYFAMYTPLGDTGLVSIDVYAGELYWNISFDRNQTVYRSQVNYRD